MTNQPRVYLAGPMKGRSVESATGWREELRALLAPEIVCYSPMRQVAECAGSNGRVEASYAHHVLHNQKSLTTRDRLDVMRADLVIVNVLGAEVVSIGTCIEVGWADAFRVPIVLIDDTDGTTWMSTHAHPMLREAAGWHVESVADAAYVTRSVLLP